MTSAGHRVYLISLWTKVIFAVAECLTGLAVYFITTKEIQQFTRWILHLKIFADPHDRRTVFVQNALAGIPMNAKTFLVVYLLLHGLLKIAIVFGLLSGKPLAYPLGLLGLGAFVTYQLWHYHLHGQSAILVLAAFDVFIMVMVWREWREKFGTA